MTTWRKFTNEDYKEAIRKAYEDGHKFVAYLWDGIQFDNLIIKRVYEVKH